MPIAFCWVLAHLRRCSGCCEGPDCSWPGAQPGSMGHYPEPSSPLSSKYCDLPAMPHSQDWHACFSLVAAASQLPASPRGLSLLALQAGTTAFWLSASPCSTLKHAHLPCRRRLQLQLSAFCLTCLHPQGLSIPSLQAGTAAFVFHASPCSTLKHAHLPCRRGRQLQQWTWSARWRMPPTMGGASQSGSQTSGSCRRWAGLCRVHRQGTHQAGIGK